MNTDTAPSGLLQLIWLASPALPIGGFSYSEGLEAAIEQGLVHHEQSATDWVVDQLHLTQSRGDMAVMAQAIPAWQIMDTQRIVRLVEYPLTPEKNKVDFSNSAVKYSGSNAKLEAGFDDAFYSGNSPYIDLQVKVPARFDLQLDDGSGDTDIRGLKGDLQITDGSGDLHIRGGNNARITDGSGALSVRQLTGSLQLEDGSGELLIEDIAGDVTVDDGSGDLTIRAVGGVVTIDDGSGDIDVDGAGGLTIVDSGSGGLKLNAINGPVNIDD